MVWNAPRGARVRSAAVGRIGDGVARRAVLDDEAHGDEARPTTIRQVGNIR